MTENKSFTPKNIVLETTRFPDYVVAYLPRVPPDTNTFALPMIMYEVIAAALEYIEKSEFENWQIHVSSKLDEISRNLDAVINELRHLRLWMDERLTEEARRIFHSEIDALRKGVEDILSGSIDGQLTQEQKNRLERDYLAKVKTVTDQLANWSYYGFSHFDGVLSGIITVLLIYRLIFNDLVEAKSYARRVIRDFLEPAIAVENQKSLEAARNQCAVKALEKANYLNGHLNRWWLTNFTETFDVPDVDSRPKPPRRDQEYIIQRPTGDLTNGFTRVAEHSHGNPRLEWYPHIEYRYKVHDGADRSWHSVHKDLERMRSDVLTEISNEGQMRNHVASVSTIISKLQTFIDYTGLQPT